MKRHKNNKIDQIKQIIYNWNNFNKHTHRKREMEKHQEVTNKPTKTQITSKY